MSQSRSRRGRVIRWDEPGYVVAFTTRAGGVSAAPYDSLNLTIGTGDDRTCVEENRRLACEAIGVPATTLAFNRQVHSATVHRARAGARGEPGDGLWTDEPGVPMLAMSADCLPIAVARATGERRACGPARRLARACRRRRRCRRVCTVLRRRPEDRSSRDHRPGDRPVLLRGRAGGRRSSSTRPDARREARSVVGGRARAARAGVERVERVDLCTRCHPELFFSHRRDGRARGVQGVIGAVA